ncbi:hypothetical protein KO516_21460 [Citreicella sp. C3M06]|uniref:hypothetical protein n=1 Tax=Citreicella sp. C3M06 TaxID=2841564 RepID=UPI001C099E80|nr:hypothetical protein [Citreicella sp. C3M06]MBU2963344.1 hypothetical protein [Citreicella sp. C3M06]
MNMNHEQFAVAKVRPGRAGKVPVSIWDLLVWAFQVERVGLDFDEVGSTSGVRPGVGMEYILMKRGDLGCSIDGGGQSDPHPDADLVASAVSCLPEGCGGRGMAVAIAEMARSGCWPDWGRNMVPGCEPVEWRRCKHGMYAARSLWDGLDRWPAHLLGQSDGYACRVVFTATPADIARARRAWLGWWGALLELRCTFQMRCDLTGFEVVDEMPPRSPWKKVS